MVQYPVAVHFHYATGYCDTQPPDLLRFLRAGEDVAQTTVCATEKILDLCTFITLYVCYILSFVR